MHHFTSRKNHILGPGSQEHFLNSILFQAAKGEGGKLNDILHFVFDKIKSRGFKSIDTCVQEQSSFSSGGGAFEAPRPTSAVGIIINHVVIQEVHWKRLILCRKMKCHDFFTPNSHNISNLFFLININYLPLTFFAISFDKQQKVSDSSNI